MEKTHIEKSTHNRWIITTLIGIICMGLGGFISDKVGNSQLLDHSRKEGHPVLVERVDDLEDDITEIKLLLREINNKLK